MLFDLAHQGLNEDVFKEMWFRYKGSLLDCKANKYLEFIFKQYLKEAEPKRDFKKNKKKQGVYSFILERAEKRYLNKEIFNAV